MKRRIRCAIGVAALVVSGCGRVPRVSPDGVSGKWTASLDSSITLELTLHNIDSTDTSAVATNMQIDRPTHTGHYTLTAPFALDTTISGARPSVLARETGADSILIAVEPYVDHGSLVLSGLRSGDTITGSWAVTGYVILRRGTFVMHRGAGRS
jgi:hypothetical protein